MAKWTVILYKRIGSHLAIKDLGIYLVSGESRNVTDNFSYDELAASADLKDAITNDLVAVNDGTELLTLEQSLNYIFADSVYNTMESYVSLSGGHPDITLRNSTDSHPMSAITDLSSTVDSLSAAIGGDVSGLEILDEGNGDGWRLRGRVATNYGNIGVNAIDFSTSIIVSGIYGATGSYSFATGNQTIASGDSSCSVGDGTVAQNTGSHAAGMFNVGLDYNTVHEIGIGTGFGDTKNAFEIYKDGRVLAPELTTTMVISGGARGLITKEWLDIQVTALDTAITNTGINANNYTDEQIQSTLTGGSSASNAYTDEQILILDLALSEDIDQNSTDILSISAALSGAGGGDYSTDIIALSGAIDDNTTNIESNDTDIIALSGAISSSTPSGLESLNEGSGDGWRLIGKDPTTAGNIGLRAVDISYSPQASTIYGATGELSFCHGYRTRATGQYSFASGRDGVANGQYDFSIGYQSYASGGYSFCGGTLGTATRPGSFSMGSNCDATGDYSAALNYWTIASGNYGFASGRHTDATGTASCAVNYYTLASGSNSFASGERCEARNFATTATGSYTIAQNWYSHASGKYNIGTSADTLYEFGIGTAEGDRRNAFEIYDDGTATLPETTISEITSRGDKAIATVEYVNGSTGITALSAAIDTNTSDILDNSTDIIALSGSVDDNTTDISNNTTDIIALSGAIDTISNGLSGSRPVGVSTGYFYFDTSFGQPIWYDGSDWVDATGTTI